MPAPRPLKGERYAIEASAKTINIIQNWLPYADFEEVTQLFKSQWARDLPIADVRLLGCNDRYYLLTGILNRKDAIHPWLYDRCRQVEADPDGHLDLWARFHFKDLDVLTPVLTTKGWKSHGDLKPGDYVYSPSGKPTRVIATRQFTDSVCYRVTFDNNIQIVCGAGHLWRVDVVTRERVPGTWQGQEAGSKRKGRKTLTLETSELAKRRDLYRPAIALCEPLQNRPADLPIDPYVLGAWLGDGNTNGGLICGADAEVFEEIERRGYRLSPTHCAKRAPFRMSTIYGLVTKLRALGVLGNKHIPVAYLLASETQRRDLLWGLIDTDGTTSAVAKNATVQFSTKHHHLALEVQTLANSLGYKARVTPVRPSNTWHVSFQATARDLHPPCFLPRKRAALHDAERRRKSKAWTIVSVKRVKTVRTNCIQVASEDGMYLAGKELIPTHNSTVITFAGTIQEVLCDPDIRIVIFSNTVKISAKFLAQIKGELENNEFLKRLYRDVLWANPSKEAEKWSLEKGLTVKRSGNPKEATIEAHGLIDAMPTGGHWPLHIYDDLITEKNVTNPEQIQKATIAVQMADNLGDLIGTRKWFIGTRYHFGDTYGQLLKDEILKPRLFPATHDGTLNGTPVLLSPERWREVLRNQRDTLAAQMLQNPLAGQENMFKAEWLKPYYVRPTMLNVYIMGDPSLGIHKTSDRTAIAVVGVDTGLNKYLLDGYCHRMSLSERWEVLRDLYIKWSNMNGVQSVQVGYERYGMQSDLEYFDERMRVEEHAPRFEIKELNWTRNRQGESKAHRVGRLEPDFRNASFFVPAQVWHPRAPMRPKLQEAIREGRLKAPDDTSTALWALTPDGQSIAYQMRVIPHPQETQCARDGDLWRLMKPLRRLDEDGNIYDLTRVLFEEYLFFPFSPRDDLLDAMSRIYDMEPKAASKFESIEPEDYPDS